MPDFSETFQNWSAGELDPGAALRDDRDFYRTGLRAAKNVVLLPTGGFRDRGGFRHLQQVRGVLSEVTTGDAFEETGPAGGGALRTYDLGIARTIHLVDVLDFVTTAPTVIVESWRVEYSTDNATWHSFDGWFDAERSASSRRAGLAPGQSVTARYWRVYGNISLQSANVTCAGLIFWTETAALSNARAFGFAFSEEAGASDYLLVHTDRNVEIYQDEVRVASAGVVHTSARVPYVTRAQSLDTLLLFHQEEPPHRVFRSRGDAQWDSRPQPFQNIPQVRFAGEIYTNGVNELQRILLYNFEDGDLFSLGYGGVYTYEIAHAASTAVVAANIAAALEAHPAIGAGNVSVTYSSGYEVEFIGDLAASPRSLLTLQYIGPGDGDENFEIVRVEAGFPGGEDIMSVDRGWPACGAFHQSRLVLAGFAARPETVLFSALGDYFNLDITIEEADAALSLSIDSDQIRVIRQLYSGNHLTIWTDGAEFWIADRVIAKGEPISFARATQRGVRPGVPVLPADDVLLFAQRDGKAVRGFGYEEGRQRYVAPNVSRLSAHLIPTPVDWDVLPAPDGRGADHVWMAKADGSAALFCAMAEEDFLPWAAVETDGAFRSFGVEGKARLYAVVAREANGVTTNRLEVYDQDMLYDGGLTVTQASAASVSGFAHLAGRTVELWLDGRPRGAATVAGDGTIALPVAAETVMAGLPFDIEAEIMPVALEIGGTTRGRRGRIHEARLSLMNTGAISVAANGEDAVPVNLRAFGDGAFDALTDTLFTGEIEVDSLPGYSAEPTLRITQPFRAPIQVRGFTIRGRIA